VAEPAGLERIRTLLASSPFISLFGLEIVEADAAAGRLVMAMEFRPELERVHSSGHLHGGAIATLVDTVACMALAQRGGYPPPTVNFRVDFLRPAQSSKLRAIANVRRAGRSLGVVDVDVVDETGEPVALGRVTFAMGR
jgi:uncharacterized protein (TIGR00369 family)